MLTMLMNNVIQFSCIFHLEFYSSYIFEYYISFLMVCIACNDADAINV